jgi:NAD(P)-dependent dehydrogenase (short-subunit alcohol dehydrogenase family)
MNKVLLITGGSRGIGAATARLAAQQGFRVVVNYLHDKVAAEALAKEIGCIAIQADVSKPEEVSRMFAEIDTRLGKTTHVVNSAGVTGKGSKLVDADITTIRETLDTNLLGTILVCREAVKHMSARLGGTGGVIVNISSGATTIGSANEFVWYAASKAGVDSFTLGLGRELAEEGIRVVAVAPGLIDTELHARSTGEPGRVNRMREIIPMKREGSPDEIAKTVLFLLSDEASYITATTLRVSGGR